jgi:hypothetical protein
MANSILLVIVDMNRTKKSLTEYKNKYLKDYPEFVSNRPIVGDMDYISIDPNTTHDGYLIQVARGVNQYIMDCKVPNGTVINVYDPTMMEVYTYDWHGGYIFEVPKTFLS